MSDERDTAGGGWPELDFDRWADTRETLHLWTQVAGKVKLALCPFLNHWWEVAFELTASGLGSGLIPVSYTHLRAHETRHDLVRRLLLEKKKQTKDIIGPRFL